MVDVVVEEEEVVEVEEVEDVDFEEGVKVVEVLDAPTAAVFESGHSDTAHASTEQQPWKSFALQTYHSCPCVHSRDSRMKRD